MIIDSHAHLTSDQLYSDVDAIVQRALDSSIDKIINICTDEITYTRGLELSSKYPFIYNAAATTPHDVEKEGELYFELFKKAAQNKKLIAIGETGLDYFYEHSPKELQKEFFIKYLKLAIDCNLPIIIHCRDAFNDFFKIIDEHYPLKRRGVLHCFTGSVLEAEELVKRDWYVSFSGIITFKKSIELREALTIVPLENILIETDSPYLAPQSKRGKVNEPANVIETAKMIATVKEVSLDTVLDCTTKNAKELFKLQ